MSARALNSGLVVFLIGVAAARTSAAWTYFIGESTDFTGNGCENTNLNTITASLKGGLDVSGWSGTRYVNADSWPNDFMESCNTSTYGNGGDFAWSDAHVLAVYAGHGSVGSLQWGYKAGDMCTVDMKSSSNVNTTGVMRLGQMDGATASYGVWLTSCTLKKDRLTLKAN